MGQLPFVRSDSLVPSLNAAEASRVMFVGMKQAILEFYTAAKCSGVYTGTFVQINIQPNPTALLKSGDQVQLWNDSTGDKLNLTLVKDMLPSDTRIYIEEVSTELSFPNESRIVFGDFFVQYISMIDRSIKLGVSSWDYIEDEDGNIIEDEEFNPILSVEGDLSGRVSQAESYIDILLEEITLLVRKENVTAEINLGVLGDSLGNYESFINLMADNLNISGLVTLTNFNEELTALTQGTGGIIRSDTAPTVRANGDDLRVGDIWIDTTGGLSLPYSWDGDSWEEAFTKIDGGKIVTGSIIADKLSVDELSTITANMGALTVDNVLTIAEGGRLFNANSYDLRDNGVFIYAPGGGKPSGLGVKTKLRFNYDPADEEKEDSFSVESFYMSGPVIAPHRSATIFYFGPDEKAGPSYGEGLAEFHAGDLTMFLTKDLSFLFRDVPNTTDHNIMSTSYALEKIAIGNVIGQFKMLEVPNMEHTGTLLGFFGNTPVVRQAALTTPSGGVANSGDVTTDTIISNLVTRVGELESRLQAYNLIA